MKHLFLVFSVLFLAACSGSDNSSPKITPSQDGTVRESDTTDRSMCKGIVPPGTSIMRTTWTMKQTLPNGVQITRWMYFTLNDVEIKEVINYQTISKNLLVKARLIMSSNRFSVTETVQDQTSFLVNGEEKSFKLELKPQLTLFNFVGPCLRLVQDNAETILVPQQ